MGARDKTEAYRPKFQSINYAILNAQKRNKIERYSRLPKVLEPNVAFRADNEAMRQGSVPEIRGAMAVAEGFKGRARSALPVLVDRGFGLVIAPDERQRIVLRLSC
ncbi:hypothetical protein ASD02_23730 [Ensifer sp. Root1252]|nr:hypothetical protein ASD02_23730 [Ensifer sp. Root1252]KRC78044.1 hypothetical protein ASE32_28340 [Ensifer sp. Root231]KRD00465.1 hypothetical protein ASE47_24310 [Ensifer sp. Root258]